MSEEVSGNEHSIEANSFREKLIAWGTNNFRSFPWRETKNPYHILIAEVMLHRTQANQVVPVYEKFIQLYPDIPTLAQASKDELHKVLHSLGLHWRIDLIQIMSIELIKEFDGKVPKSKSDLLSLSGVSDYIASAILCFAWNIPEPLIDTNSVRVVGRVFGLEMKDSSRRNQQYRDLIGSLVDKKDPRSYNYAILDLANLLCMKKRPPDCYRCPVRQFCQFSFSHMKNTRNITKSVSI